MSVLRRIFIAALAGLVFGFAFVYGIAGFVFWYINTFFYNPYNP